MLNRRSVRIRAMQALYAFEKTKGANYLLALDQISEAFAPDLNSAQRQDRKRLKGLEKLAHHAFAQEIKDYTKIDEDEIIPEVDKEVKKAVTEYHINNKNGFNALKRDSLVESETVYTSYLQLLSLYIEIGEENALKPIPGQKSSFKDNKIITALAQNKELESKILRKNASFTNEKAFITKLYKEVFKKNNRFVEYVSKTNHTAEEDLVIIKYILKNIFLKHELVEEHFGLKSLFWSEDKNTLRSKLNQTYINFPSTGEITVQELDELWEQNKEFLGDLLDKSWSENEKLEKILLPNLKNWDFDRIAELDKIILKLSLIELIHYPYIPIKVTINESLEVAKEYSTPKSALFINGVLDKISKEYTTNGTIVKTGRGMLDNK